MVSCWPFVVRWRYLCNAHSFWRHKNLKIRWIIIYWQTCILQLQCCTLQKTQNWQRVRRQIEYQHLSFYRFAPASQNVLVNKIIYCNDLEGKDLKSYLKVSKCVVSQAEIPEGGCHIKMRGCSSDLLGKNMTGILCNVRKKMSNRAHRTGSWYLLGFLFKISDEHPLIFIWQPPSGISAQETTHLDTFR